MEVITRLLPRAEIFLIDYEARLIQAEWLIGIRAAIRLNSSPKAQKIAEVLGDELSKITKELFIFESYHFYQLVKGENWREETIPIEQWPDRKGRSLNHLRQNKGEAIGLSEAD